MLKKVIANILPRAWNSLSIFLLLPIYISVLGVEGYGVVAFFGVLLGTIAFVDSGLTSTVTREMAASLVTRNNESDIVVTLERCYFLIVTVFFLISPLIENWFLLNYLKGVAFAQQIYYLMISAALLTMVGNFYIAAMIGKERQILANSLLLIASLLKTIIGLIAIFVFEELLLAFFISQVIMCLAIVIAFRYILLSNILKESISRKFCSDVLTRNLKFTGGLFLISVIASINTQVDKIFVNSMEGLTVFASYAAAAAIAQLPLLIASPIGRAYYPSTVVHAERGDKKSLIGISINSNRLFVFLAGLLLYSIYFLSEELFPHWLKEGSMSTEVLAFFPILFLANLAIGMQVFVFNIALAFQYTKINVYLGIFNASLMLFLVPHLLDKYEINGMLLGLLTINWIIFFMYSAFVFYKFKMPQFFTWLTKTLITPLLLLFGVSYLTSLLVVFFGNVFYMKVVVVLIMVSLAIFIQGLLSGGLDKLFLFSKKESV